MSLPRPDFLRPRAGPPWFAWALLATALAAVAVAALDAHDAWREREVALAAQAVQRRVEPVRPAARRPSGEQAATDAMRRALERPWLQTFEAVEGIAAPGVAWLSLDVSEAGDVQLAGIAPDGASALAVAQRLREAGLWSDAVLTRMDQGSGKTQRFELKAAGLKGTP